MRKLFISLFLVGFIITSTNIFSQALSGNYFIPQGAHPQGFPNLADAITAVNTNGLAGNTTFYITADLDHSAAALPILQRSDLTENTRLFIRPFAQMSPVITLTGAAGLDIRNTSYVTIDGNSGEPTVPTRNLTFLMNSATGGGNGVISVTENCTLVVIKNVKVEWTTVTAASVGIRFRRNDGDTNSPKFCLVENCQIGTETNPFSDGVRIWGTEPNAPKVDVLYSDIYTSHRGITTLFMENNIYAENHIRMTNPRAGQTWYTGMYLAGGTGSRMVIANNIFSQLGVNRTSTGYVAAINININYNDSVDIYNNFFAINLSNTGTNNDNRVYGIAVHREGFADVYNIYHNTFLFPENNQTGNIAAIGFEPGTNFNPAVDDSIKALFRLGNNIIVNHNNTATSYGIHWPLKNGLQFSNYNNIFVSGANAHVGYWDNAPRTTLANWQTASNSDANSKSKSVAFVSNTDLHLAGTSIGDFDLAGMPISWITSDIDGNPRSANAPYMGADEANIPLEPTDPDLLLEENFAYGSVDNPNLVDLTANWFRHSGTAGPGYSADGLIYPGYLSSNIGGAVPFTNGSSGNNDGDIHRVFAKVEQTQNVYASFIINLTSALATADYFFHLGPDPIGTVFRGRVFARSNGSGWSFGLSKSSEARTDDNTILNFNQTYLVILKYSFNTAAANDDLVTLYVYETGIPATEPGSPIITIGPLGAGVASDPINIGAVAIRQGTNTPTGKIDGIRVANTWTSIVVPVELVSFTANVNLNNVTLNWSTATEINNAGFEIERKLPNTAWTKVGFVPGNGTTTEIQQYSFSDNNLASGIYSYRLKQIDFDGSYEYSNTIEVEVISPSVYQLSQNYPNPFNPVTNITYYLPVESKVTLSIYSITGELVKELVNEIQNSGSYSVSFDAGNLSSGMYIYRLVAGDFIQSNKMMLMK